MMTMAKIILNQQSKRYRLIQDNDSHWYLIEANQEDNFNKWVEFAEGETDEYIGTDFDSKRLSGSPSNVTFTDPQEN